MIDYEKYKKTLEKQVAAKKLSEKTAKAYLSCMSRLCDALDGSDAPDDIYNAIIALGNGEQVTKFIASVKKYERDILDRPKALLYGENLIRLREYKQKKIGRQLKLPEKTYMHKINALKNKKLKLAFRLQAKSGLRIAEIAALKPGDIQIDDSRIKIDVRAGKGGKQRFVDVVDDDYLKKELKAFIKDKPLEEPLFYSAAYLKKKAGEYGLETHDLRRLNSKLRFRNELESGDSTRREARREVQAQLGHEEARTTSAYLGTDWDNEE